MSTTTVSGTIPDTDRIEDLPEDGATAPSTIDTAELGKILLGRWPEARLAARKRAEDPRFQSQSDQSFADQRNVTFEQLKLLADAGPQYLGMPESVGGAMSPGACASNAAIMSRARNRNIPAFQRKVPASSICCARS